MSSDPLHHPLIDQLALCGNWDVELVTQLHQREERRDALPVEPKPLDQQDVLSLRFSVGRRDVGKGRENGGNRLEFGEADAGRELGLEDAKFLAIE